MLAQYSRCPCRDAWRWLARIACLLALCATGPVAHAHAMLVATEPADGGVLASWPEQVALRFNEPVSPLVFSLISPDGLQSKLDRTTAIDNGLRIDLPARSAPGTYALSWRAVSADGHPVAGALTFALGLPGQTVAAPGMPGAAQDVGPWRAPAIWLWRCALYLSLFAGVGGALFRAWVGAQASRDAAAGSRCAIWLGAAALPLCLGLQGLDALNAPWQSAFEAAPWLTALQTSYSHSLALAALALAAARFALSARTQTRMRLIATAGLLLLGAAFAASGHASAAPPQWLARPMVCLHAMAVAVWLGALLPLWRLARHDDAAYAQTLRTFSARIPWVVAVLVASGFTLAWLQVDQLASLWRKDYGRVLLGKLCLVAVLFMLAAWNRYRLTVRVLANDRSARAALGRIVRIEIALAIGVLALVALWRFTPPPRAQQAAAAPTAVASLRNAAAAAELDFTPAGRSRPGWLRLTLTDASSAPLRPKAVTVSFINKTLGLEPITRVAHRTESGRWEIAPLRLPALAEWNVRVDILMTDFDRIRLEGDLAIPHGAAVESNNTASVPTVKRK